MRRYVFLILMILWMVVIFLYSTKDAVESTEDSYAVGMAIGKAVVPHFEEASPAEQLAFVERVDHPVRKTAHVMEYTLLGFLTAGTFFEFLGTAGTKARLVLSWFVATLYAATDEIHQLYVIGRSGQVLDVCLDSAGVLMGVAIFALLYNKKKKGVI